MSELIHTILAAYGGRARWNELHSIHFKRGVPPVSGRREIGRNPSGRRDPGGGECRTTERCGEAEDTHRLGPSRHITISSGLGA
jgi:hypothetical protein